MAGAPPEPAPRPGGEGAPRALIVTVGDELLLGRTVDTNAAWLGIRLSAMGFQVVRRATVGDDDLEITRAVRAALGDADLVVVTGGLGPTADDRTRPAVAGLLEAPLLLDDALLEDLRRRFLARGEKALPASNRSQALVPRGARILPNALGTAPGLAMEAGNALVVLLPGVPREMRGIWQDVLSRHLEERFEGRLRPAWHRTLHTTGIAESALAEEVERRLPADRDGVAVAYLPDLRGVDVRFTVRGGRADAEALFDRLEGILEPLLEGVRFRAPSGDLAEAVARELAERGRTLATAESCTGGLLAKRLTDRPGASAWFLGGVVAYADAVKTRELGVGRELLEAHGAVSEEVARAMAEGAERRFGSDHAVAITGVAGPGGGTEEKPVGLVWIATRGGGRTEARRALFAGDREGIRERSAQAALALLLRSVEGSGGEAP